MLSIAWVTAKELLRNKIMIFLLIFSLVFLIFTIFLGNISLGQPEKVMTDFGLSLLEIFGIVLILFFGNQLLFREIEGKTIYLLLVKPISRQTIYFGKFLGFIGVLSIVFFFQTALYLSLLYFKGVSISLLLCTIIVYIFITLVLVLAVLMCFSSFSSPVFSLLMTLGVYISGISISEVVNLFRTSDSPILQKVFEWFGMIFPPFHALNLKNLITFGQLPSPEYFIYSLVWALVYLTIITTIGSYVFAKKSF